MLYPPPRRSAITSPVNCVRIHHRQGKCQRGCVLMEILVFVRGVGFPCVRCIRMRCAVGFVCVCPLNRSHFISPIVPFSFHGREIFNLSLACCHPASPPPSICSTQLHAPTPQVEIDSRSTTRDGNPRRHPILF